MAADAFKNRNSVPPQVAENHPRQSNDSSSCRPPDEKNILSLGLDEGNDTSDFFNAPFVPSHVLANTDAANGSVGPQSDWSHIQDLQHGKPFSYSASSIQFPHGFLPTQDGINLAYKYDKTLEITSAPAVASPPLIRQEATDQQDRGQILGNQEQFMLRQMKHLLWLVAEQQKIINFYNPETSLLQEETWFENLPSITEEKGSLSISENASLSPFGTRMKIPVQNVDDRPIRPGIREKQKTFEELVEEHLRIDSQSPEKQQQNCEAQVTARKSFLKCGEGKARLEKNRVNLGKESDKLLRKVSFECHDNFSWPIPKKIGRQLRKHLQLKRRARNPAMLTGVEKAVCIASQSDIKDQVNNCKRSSEERKGSHNSCGCSIKEIINEKDSEVLSQVNGPKHSQEYHDSINEIQTKVTEKADTSYLMSSEHLYRIGNKSTNAKGPKSPVEGQVVLRIPRVASPLLSDLQDLENSQNSQQDQNSTILVTQSMNGIKKCDSEISAVEKNPEEISPEFKKVNDQIVKVILKPDGKPNTTSDNSERKHYHDSSSSSKLKGSRDSTCSSTESEDEPRSLCYPVKYSGHKITDAVKNTLFSDADYATDGPSGAEDYPTKSHEKSPNKNFGILELPHQQKPSFTSGSSSSESSVNGGVHRGGKTLTSLRESPFHCSQTISEERDLEIQNKDTGDNYSTEFSRQSLALTSDLVASLFPVFKSKVNLEEKRAALEQVQKGHSGKLEECRSEIPVHLRETSLLAQMKEEQTKAMDFLRKQIKQFETVRSQTSHPLDQCKTEEPLHLQNEKAEVEKTKMLDKVNGESEKIWILKQQIAGLQEEFRRNETHWHAAHDELKSRVETLTKQNLELKEELRISELQKVDTERQHGVMDFAHRKPETPVFTAILRGISSEEERPLQDSCKIPSNSYLGRKTPLDELVPGERNTKAAKAQKSAMRDQRMKSPSKTLRSRTSTPTVQRTPHQMPSELQKMVPHNEEQSCGQNPPVPESKPTIKQKDTGSTLSVKGSYSSTSGSSEDAAFLKRLNSDISRSPSLNNVEIQISENHKRAQKSKTHEQVASTTISTKRNHVISSGRKTPNKILSVAVDANRKDSPLKSIMSRTSQYIDSKEDVGVKEKIEYPDGKVKELFTDGRRVTTYPNGTKMEISADRRTVVTFYNGDIKTILPDQRVIYYYADAQTTRTLYPSGLEVLEFPNNQIEKYHPDGSEEIVFPDQTVKHRYDGGMMEETVFPDGTVVKVEKNGVKTILFCNGEKEIHTALSTRREYPDGTVRTVYAKDQQETKYSSGRVQIKEKRGVIIPDK